MDRRRRRKWNTWNLKRGIVIVSWKICTVCVWFAAVVAQELQFFKFVFNPYFDHISDLHENIEGKRKIAINQKQKPKPSGLCCANVLVHVPFTVIWVRFISTVAITGKVNFLGCRFTPHYLLSLIDGDNVLYLFYRSLSEHFSSDLECKWHAYNKCVFVLNVHEQ